MLGIEITPVAVAKDLGIYIDQSPLTYNDHVTKTASNCLHKLIQINRIKHLLDSKTLILLMNCFVFSKRLYCSTVLLNTSFAARIVLGLRKFDHISQGIRSLNWLSVCDRLYLNDAIMIFKCIHNLVPDYLAEKFTFRSMGRTWEKFSSLPAKKRQKFETATGKENFQTETEGRTGGRKWSVTRF